MLIMIYMDLYHVFDFLNVQLDRYSFTLSFTEHVILLILFFPFLFRLSVSLTLSCCGGYLLRLLLE